MPSKPFSVELRAEIKKGRRMQRVIEVSIPVSNMAEAERLRQPFCNAIIRAVKSSRRRRSLGKGEQP